MGKAKASKRNAEGGVKAKASKRPEPEPPSAEAIAVTAEAEAKQAQLAEELRSVEEQAR